MLVKKAFEETLHFPVVIVNIHEIESSIVAYIPKLTLLYVKKKRKLARKINKLNAFASVKVKQLAAPFQKPVTAFSFNDRFGNHSDVRRKLIDIRCAVYLLGFIGEINNHDDPPLLSVRHLAHGRLGGTDKVVGRKKKHAASDAGAHRYFVIKKTRFVNERRKLLLHAER